MAPRLAIKEIALGERPVRFTRPFRFGATTVDAAPQAFVRVTIEVEGHGRAQGGTAEMMMPRWFDKNPDLSPAETIDQLRRSLHLARQTYLSNGMDTAFGHHARNIEAHVVACGRERIPALAAAFGPAQIDKAILDALLAACGLDLFRGLGQNIAGLDARLTPDLSDAMIGKFLAARKPSPSIYIRHTLGLLDPVGGADCALSAARMAGARYFKIKLGGDPTADIARLAAIARAAGDGDLGYTLDANEQYSDPASLATLVAAVTADKALAPIRARLLYIEQPLPRDITLRNSLDAIAARIPFTIDEADDCYDAFPKALALGYRGVSSKACKGYFKSLLNAARAAHRGDGAFIAAEDLTCQPGLAVQQDTALVAFLGVTHAERNGHIYGAGFGGAPDDEARAFCAAHPTFYRREGESARLRVDGGRLDAAALAAPGFASRAHPNWAVMAPLAAPTELEETHGH